MKKKISTMFVIVIFLLALSVCSAGADKVEEPKPLENQKIIATEADSSTESSLLIQDTIHQTWQSAYLEIIYNVEDYLAVLYEPDGTNTRSTTPELFNPENLWIYLGLHDFNDDGTLELIAGDTLTLAVFTYEDGQAEKIADLYYPDIAWCVNGVYFKDNSISVDCGGSGGIVFVNFGYLDGIYLLGLYNEWSESDVIINGKESTLEEMNRIYTLDFEQRGEDELKQRVRLVNEDGIWKLKYQSGEEAVLDTSFNFNSIIW